MINRVIRYFLENKLVTILLFSGLLLWGILVAPFGWELGSLPSDPVPVDAIPDIGENQQIIFTKWPGHSPQDIEDQVTYPLTTALLGISGVKSIRSNSVFGFSSIYLIFDEDVEFYWSRSRILEKLSSLPPDLLPTGVQPSLGPDATALGQVFWYTLEGRDASGQPTGGWDLHEIRTVQDFFVKYGLSAVDGVSEVASIGGFVQEYQIDVDPDALKVYGVSLSAVLKAVKMSNLDVGAKTIELNKVEYLVRGLGYFRSVEDIEEVVVDVHDNVPVRLKDLAFVTIGPAIRRGVLDKEGAEVVGGVVIARYGSNPLQVINDVKSKIKELSSGLPTRTLPDGTTSQLAIVPFYDRSGLIHETLGTLEEALTLEALVCILVVLVMVYNLRASLIISSLLPVAVIMVFIAMKLFAVDANIVALSGIAIAIGTMVDLGIILTENIVKHLDASDGTTPLLEVIYEASAEVSSAIVTAVSTTIVSFIPVFTLQAAEGKLFSPLAFTKTFALVSALVVSILLLPSLAHIMYGLRFQRRMVGHGVRGGLVVAGLLSLFWLPMWIGVAAILLGLAAAFAYVVRTGALRVPAWLRPLAERAVLVTSIALTSWMLTRIWMPLGANVAFLLNLLFLLLCVGGIIAFFMLVERSYRRMLVWCLEHKTVFLAIPVVVILLGGSIWLGYRTITRPIAVVGDVVGLDLEESGVWTTMSGLFPGIGNEFMPALDEGSFLLMPTSMPHSGIEYNKEVLAQLDMMMTAIPEVDMTVGKLGRVESAIDPAPISMFENVINYKPEYATDEQGHRRRFAVNDEGWFITQMGDTLSNDDALLVGVSSADLIEDGDGHYFRNWRSHIHTADDVWNEIAARMVIPGVTNAPRLQPIQTRLVMLQTGMRAPMGLKVFGPDLETIEAFGVKLESVLKRVPSVKAEAVFADRIVGKPYVHLNIDRQAIARYGLHVADVQEVIEAGIGGTTVTSTVEGRERFPVRVRYPRSFRSDPERLGKVYVQTRTGAQIPLTQLVTSEFVRGPQSIKSENTFLVGYVLFDKQDGFAEVEVVQDADQAIQAAIDEGDLVVPQGVSYQFSGSYENQVRAENRLRVIVPVVFFVIFLILYFQFRSVSTSLMIFTGVAVAFSGGFLLLWLYGQAWFLHVDVFGMNLRDLFDMHTINLSVAVWVGFIALFGIATDDGVLIGTYLDQSFVRNRPTTIPDVRAAIVQAGLRRVRPALVTGTTTMIALLPVLSSTGRGSDIMVPMAIPTFGGMAIIWISMFIVPVLYAIREERAVAREAS